MNRRHTAHHARRGVLTLAGIALAGGAVIAVTAAATGHDTAAPPAAAPLVAAVPAQPAPPPMPVSAEHNMADSMATPAGQAAAAASERVTRDRQAAASLPAAQALQARLDQAVDGQPLLFGPDTATLTPEGRARLAQIVDVLRSSPAARVEIVGHTAVEIANPPLCLQLSQLRAEQVATRLAAAGIDPDRVTAVGVSHTQPLPTAAASRRAEVVAVAD